MVLWPFAIKVNAEQGFSGKSSRLAGEQIISVEHSSEAFNSLAG